MCDAVHYKICMMLKVGSNKSAETKIFIYLLPSRVWVCQTNGPKIIQPTTGTYHFAAISLFVGSN